MMMTTGNKEDEIASGLTGTMINWVDNLAGLRAMAHAMTAPVVVKGYGSAGDGGGGIFGVAGLRSAVSSAALAGGATSPRPCVT
jgi:hypothetical protein